MKKNNFIWDVWLKLDKEFKGSQRKQDSALLPYVSTDNDMSTIHFIDLKILKNPKRQKAFLFLVNPKVEKEIRKIRKKFGISYKDILRNKNIPFLFLPTGRSPYSEDMILKIATESDKLLKKIHQSTKLAVTLFEFILSNQLKYTNSGVSMQYHHREKEFMKIVIDSDVTINEIKRHWPYIEKAQEQLLGYKSKNREKIYLRRDNSIYKEYVSGVPVKEISEKYKLSEDYIRIIISRMKKITNNKPQ